MPSRDDPPSIVRGPAYVFGVSEPFLLLLVRLLFFGAQGRSKSASKGKTVPQGDWRSGSRTPGIDARRGESVALARVSPPGAGCC